ncbi:MAG TPA: DUF1501 domain-containing protein [Pirellulales bacterium]|nr:DUF1501 domain-containing protein [Pirellulales bacterium]
MSTFLSRRTVLNSLWVSAAGYSVSGWFPLFARELAANPQRRRHCVLLWMSGGAAQTDTFDLKPGHENGGEFKEIETGAAGLRFSEHLPKLAEYAQRMAVIRGLNTKEGDHGRATYLMRTGHKPMGPVEYPSIGASLANQLGNGGPFGLPGYISVGPFRAFNQEAFGPGFLGPQFAPLIVGAADVPGATDQTADDYPQLRVKDLEPRPEIAASRVNKRLALWKTLGSEFLTAHQTGAAKTHRMVYESAVSLTNSDDAAAFDLSKEAEAVREAYGKSVFGQGCLLARRLIERGVPFIEVSLGTSSGGIGWDTHADNFNQVRQLSATLDAGWATLMKELDERGLLDSTTILWMGEFGRTPRINGNQGRDHFPNAWSCVLAGGGIAGGQAFGRTSDDGMTVVDGQVGAEDVLATLCEALGVPCDAQQTSNLGRPISITDGTPIKAVLA